MAFWFHDGCVRKTKSSVLPKTQNNCYCAGNDTSPRGHSQLTRLVHFCHPHPSPSLLRIDVMVRCHNYVCTYGIDFVWESAKEWFGCITEQARSSKSFSAPAQKQLQFLFKTVSDLNFFFFHPKDINILAQGIMIRSFLVTMYKKPNTGTGILSMRHWQWTSPDIMIANMSFRQTIIQSQLNFYIL